MRRNAGWRACPLTLLRYAWAAPISMIGLLLALPVVFGGGHARRRHGVLEVAGGLPGRLLGCPLPGSGPVAAITLGHVVLARSVTALAVTRRHERVHVAQTERWGVLFLVVYPLASLCAWMRGGDAYRDNAFEVEARRRSGH